MSDEINYDWEAILEARRTGQGIVDYWRPWADYDSSCNPGVKGGMSGDVHTLRGKFFPITPANGNASRQNLARFRQLLEEYRDKAENPNYIGKFTAWYHVYQYESYIRQLEGDPKAIPEAAGKEYRAWIKWLRDNDPANQT